MARVTFVDGHWQGLQVPEDANTTELYNSCPLVWEYLGSAGRDGWELVATAPQADASGGPVVANLLFLKKEILSNEDGSNL
jgi:hypothetical protein